MRNFEARAKKHVTRWRVSAKMRKKKKKEERERNMGGGLANGGWMDGWRERERERADSGRLRPLIKLIKRSVRLRLAAADRWAY